MQNRPAEKCHAGSAGYTHTKSPPKNASDKDDLGVAYNQLNTEQQRIVDKVFNAAQSTTSHRQRSG